MRLIDATDLVRRVLKERDKIMSAIPNFEYAVANPERYRQAMHGGLRKALRCIEESPTIDAEPVRHAAWVYEIDFEDESKRDDFDVACTGCAALFSADNRDDAEIAIMGRWDYCPFCGAKMDGDEDGIERKI